MAIAFDAQSESHTGTSGSASEGAFSWTHTPVGAPAGILVFTFTNANADDATAVTYGGVSLSAVSGGRAVDTAGEPGDCKAWYLGTNVPVGAQTVQVTRVNNADVMYAVAFTVTSDANADTAVHTAITLLSTDGTLAEQSITDGSPGTNSLRFAAINSGLSGIVDNPTTPGANSISRGTNSTAGPSIDFGARVIHTVRETTAGQGARSVGFSATTSDDRAAVHLAVKETSSVTLRPPKGTMGLVAAAASVALTVSLLSGSVALAGTAPSIAGSTDVSTRIPSGQLNFKGPQALTGIDRWLSSEGILSLTGGAPTLDTGISLPAGALALTGQANASEGVVQMPLAAVVWGGFIPTVIATNNVTVSLGVGPLAYTGLAPDLRAGDSSVSLGAGSLVFKGPQRPEAKPQPAAGVIAFTGHAPLVIADIPGSLVNIPIGTLAISGQVPDRLLLQTIAVPAGSVTLSGQYLSIAFKALGAGQVAFTGYAPTVGGNVQTTIAIPAGSVIWSQITLVPATATSVALGAGSLVISTPAMDVARTGSIAIPNGALVFTGTAPQAQAFLAIPVGGLTVTGHTPLLAFELPLGAGALGFSGLQVTPIEVGVPITAPDLYQAGVTIVRGISRTVTIHRTTSSEVER